MDKLTQTEQRRLAKDISIIAEEFKKLNVNNTRSQSEPQSKLIDDIISVNYIKGALYVMDKMKEFICPLDQEEIEDHLKHKYGWNGSYDTEGPLLR